MYLKMNYLSNHIAVIYSREERCNLQDNYNLMVEIATKLIYRITGFNGKAVYISEGPEEEVLIQWSKLQEKAFEAMELMVNDILKVYKRWYNFPLEQVCSYLKRLE